jgi:hypothetical protein
VFTAAYLVLCPVIVLYGLGYFYSPGEGKNLVKTGLISVATLPPGASIVLKGRRLEEKTPAQVRNLLPGNYPLLVELPGHRPWSGLVPVEVERATVLEKILLPKTYPPTEKILPGAFSELLPHEGGPFFLLSKGSRAADLSVFDWKTGGLRPLLPKASVFGSSAVVSVFTSKGSARVLLWLRAQDRSDAFLWTRLSAAATEPADLTKLFAEKPERVEWDAEDEDVLVQCAAGGSLSRIHVPSASVNPQFAEGTRGFGFAGRKIWVLGADRVLRRFGEEHGPGEIVADDSFLAPVFAEDVFYRIRPLPKGHVLFWGSDGSLLVNRFPYVLASGEILGVASDGPPEKALVWTHGAVGVLDLARPAGPRLRWIYKSGRRITEAWWVYDGSHVLFRDGERLLLIETPEWGRPHLEELAHAVQRGPAVFYSDEAAEVFYLGAAGELLRTQVWERPALLGLPPRDEEKKEEAADERV